MKSAYLLTDALKQFAIANLGVAANASDEDTRKAIGQGLVKGKIKSAKLKELAGKTNPDKPPVTVPTQKAAFDQASQTAIDEAVQKAIAGLGIAPQQPTLTPEMVFAKSNPHQIRVKSAKENYSTSTSKAYYPEKMKNHNGDHPLAGRPVEMGFIPLEHPSELAKAVSGAFYKWCIKQSASPSEIPYGLRMTDHDNDLMNYAVREMPWTGIIKGRGMEHKIYRSKLTEMQYKSILDDTISGGIEATPVVFDDALIMFPLLYGELFPFVNVQNVAQGRRVKGATLQNPTMTSGIAEGTAIEPFNTSAFIGAFDTPIFPSVGSVLLGMDFEEDTPVNFGAKIIENWGYVVQAQLDKWIAVGDGVVEPQGIFNSVGFQSVSSDNGVGGKVTIGDLESLMFAVPKQYRFEPGAMTSYVGNDLMYRRVRKIPVGPGDERRVQGMDYGSYTALDRPWKVQNDIANGKMAYCNLRRYRMYRRLGMTVRVVTEGLELAKTNQRAIIVRMRFGGQIETGNAVSIMTDAWA
jgi:HK97 family phage major capsid protein